MSAELLNVDTVHKAYGSNPVLRGINLTIDAHEVVVLVGASGSGKSTLLRCINGLESIDAGRIMLGQSMEVSAPHADLDAVRKRIGIVFQSFNLFPHMRVLENVTLAPRKVLGLERAQADDSALDPYPSRSRSDKTKKAALTKICNALQSAFDNQQDQYVMSHYAHIDQDKLVPVLNALKAS